MRATSVKALTALLLAAAVVGCASKKAADTGATTTAPAQPAATTPVETAPVRANDAAVAQPVAETIGWEGFENNPANYSGTTDTKVIYFAFDRDDIPTAAYATLKAHAEYLKANPKVNMTVGGHADERGTPEYNVALSERRAKAVKKFLRMNGANGEQVRVVAYGEEKPAELGHDELSWAKNRRAVIHYGEDRPQ